MTDSVTNMKTETPLARLVLGIAIALVAGGAIAVYAGVNDEVDLVSCAINK